ncbi:MAG: pilus assembly protein [Chloroflexi bacterium]|nr:pilus assembly protein [Chloroflexota bacterium]
MRAVKKVHHRLPKGAGRGQSLIEFAFGMVVLLILLAGIVDLGRMLFTYIALRDAVQEGALYGSTNPTSTGAIKDRVRGASPMIYELVDESAIDVDIIGRPCVGHGIRVEAVIEDFPITMPFLGAFLGRQSVDLQAEVTNSILSPYDCP